MYEDWTKGKLGMCGDQEFCGKGVARLSYLPWRVCVMAFGREVDGGIQLGQ